MNMHFGTLPIPEAALDERFAFVGTSGSGKTYSAGVAVERLLHGRKRVGIVDPLGVWWGLRLMADGKSESGFPIVIFGGPHGDMPITASAGALIGETVAGMKESFIIDLSELGTKSNERRFMLGFLEALYRHATGEPFHLVVDEADLFAPQKALEPQLQSLMEQIVRRGRVKGFIPWLITQRPAVLSKDVLSQADALVAMKLTASQDRDALGAWIEGQANKADEKRILAELPTLAKGTGDGFLWMPTHGFLDRVRFPAKVTFDSSVTPKRGEKRVTRALRPLDVDKLRGKLAKVEEEATANDPAKLRRKISELEATIRKGTSTEVAKDVAVDVTAVSEKAYARGWDDGATKVAAELGQRVLDFAGGFAIATQEVGGRSVSPAALRAWTKELQGQVAASAARPSSDAAPKVLTPSQAAAVAAHGDFTGPQTKVLRALGLWKALGNNAPTKAMIAFVAGYSPSSSSFTNTLGALRSAGAIDYPASGCAALRVDGFEMPLDEAKTTFRGNLTGPQTKVVEALRHGDMDKPALAEATGYSVTSSSFTNTLGAMRTLGILDYPQPGHVSLNGWVFDLL